MELLHSMSQPGLIPRNEAELCARVSELRQAWGQLGRRAQAGCPRRPERLGLRILGSELPRCRGLSFL